MDMCAYRRLKAFTIIEVMLVIVLIGLIAAFAVPNYEKTIEKSIERRGFTNLHMIRGAVEVYEAKYGEFPQNDLADTSEVNNTLNTNIDDPKIDYEYRANHLGEYAIYAKPNDYSWELHSHTNFTTTVHCSSATCVACTESHDPNIPGCPY